MTPTLHSIAIFVHDIARAVEFYRDKLGLPLTKQGSFGAEFLEGETHLSVHPAVHKDAKTLVGRHTGITLFVPDLLHYCGVLHDRGVRFTTEPTQQSWGIMAMVADPDGNVLALWEDKMPEAHEHAATRSRWIRPMAPPDPGCGPGSDLRPSGPVAPCRTPRTASRLQPIAIGTRDRFAASGGAGPRSWAANPRAK